MSFQLLKAAQEFCVAPSYETPSGTRIATMARTVEGWLMDGATDEQVEAMLAAIVIERARIDRFLSSARPMAMEESADVQSTTLHGIDCHGQACDALYLAIVEGSMDAFSRVMPRVEEGDRLIRAAEADLVRYQCMYPE